MPVRHNHQSSVKRRTANAELLRQSDLDCSNSPCLSGGEPKAEMGGKTRAAFHGFSLALI